MGVTRDCGLVKLYSFKPSFSTLALLRVSRQTDSFIDVVAADGLTDFRPPDSQISLFGRFNIISL